MITPGEWVACEWKCHAPTTVKAGDVVVAECSGHGRLASESIDNARLMSAAPELLEALKGLLFLFGQDGESLTDKYERVAEQFRKETGYLAPGKDCPQHDYAIRAQHYEAWIKRQAAKATAAIAKAEGK